MRQQWCCRKCWVDHTPDLHGTVPLKTCVVCNEKWKPQTRWAYYYGQTCSQACTKTLRSRQSLSGMTGFQNGHKSYSRANSRGWIHTPQSVLFQKEQILRHSQEISKEAERYLANGFEVMELDKVRPDLIVRKNGRILAVEVELFTSHKSYATLRKKYAKYANCRIFDDIIWKVEGDQQMKNINGDVPR